MTSLRKRSVQGIRAIGSVRISSSDSTRNSSSTFCRHSGYICSANNRQAAIMPGTPEMAISCTVTR
ncbi:hypothetical protein D3C81_2299610 [compost metagenome]